MTRTEIYSFSFAGACVAIEDGLETVRSDLIERALIVGKYHAPAMSKRAMTIPVTLCSNMLVQLDQKWRLRMNKAFLTTAVLLLSSLPAFSQDTRGGDERDSSYSRKDRDLDDLLRRLGDHGREGRRGGASFVLRNGNSVVAVRCDPQDSMKACVDATLTLLDRARSMQSSGTAPGGTPGGQPPSR